MPSRTALVTRQARSSGHPSRSSSRKAVAHASRNVIGPAYHPRRSTVPSEVIVDCETGDAVVQPDTFLASKPAPPTIPTLPNANAALITQLQGLTLTAGGEADQLRNAVITVLQGQPAV